MKRKLAIDVAEVTKLYPPGTRLLCIKNRKTYQMGAKANRTTFHMMCEQTSERGTVEAAMILREFEKVKVS